MKYKMLSFICGMLVWLNVLQAEGFVADTLVNMQKGYAPIQSICVGDVTIDDDCVIHTGQKKVECYVKISLGDCVVCAAFDQKFYVHNAQKWIVASDLRAFDELLCRDGKVM